MTVSEKELIDVEARLAKRIDDLEKIAALDSELAAVKTELTNLIATTRAAIEDEQRQAIVSTQNSAKEAASAAKDAAASMVAQLRNEITDGSIVAEKAAMLRARDNNHWLRFERTTSRNDDHFSMYRTDGARYHHISVPWSEGLWVSDEFHWHQGENHVRMYPSSQCFAFLTKVTGRFEGGGEAVEIYAKDGFWYLGGGSAQIGVAAVARCVSTVRLE